MVDNKPTSAEEVKHQAIKINYFAQLPKESKTRINPFLYNKGYVKPLGLEETTALSRPIIHTPPPPARVPLEDYKFSSSVRKQTAPEYEVEPFDQPYKENVQGSNEDLLSITSELNSSERFKKLSNIFQLPMFEIHNTMQAVMSRKLLETISEKNGDDTPKRTKKKTKSKGQHKCLSVYGTKREGAEDMQQELTPKQYTYFSKMNEFKTDYLSHVLNHKEIYFQYVSMSKANTWFLNSAEFITRNNKLLEQKSKFKRNKAKFAGTFL